MCQTKSWLLSSVGIPKIDAEHQHLQTLIDNLASSIARRGDPDIVLRQFAELFEAWHAHCRKEESILEERGSTRLATMKGEHDRIRRRIAELSEQYEANPEEFENSAELVEIRRMAFHHVSRFDAPAFKGHPKDDGTGQMRQYRSSCDV